MIRNSTCTITILVNGKTKDMILLIAIIGRDRCE